MTGASSARSSGARVIAANCSSERSLAMPTWTGSAFSTPNLVLNCAMSSASVTSSGSRSTTVPCSCGGLLTSNSLAAAASTSTGAMMVGSNSTTGATAIGPGVNGELVSSSGGTSAGGATIGTASITGSTIGSMTGLSGATSGSTGGCISITVGADSTEK